MSVRSLVLVTLMLAAPLPLGSQPAADPIASLSWMSGCWSRAVGARVVEEAWLSPRAGGMLGMGRTTDGTRLVEFEFMRIHQRGDTLIFAASPSGQAPSEFRARPPYATEVVFENPAHDFPQRVRYKRAGKDSLHARVEGTRNGAVRGVDFHYARVACPHGDSR